LTETTFFILLSLSSGKKHGYLIMKEVERLSGGRTSRSTGTLYGVLGRLLDQGWIERVDEG
jgi:DNA-binding PadR family transcriptional regulator